MGDMLTAVDEVADRIFRISTLVEEAAPGGFSFNQFLVVGEEPLLFHCGPRAMFPLVSEAVGRVLPVSSLRWVTFGHVESDECGAMNLWLEAAPQAEVIFNALGCDVSLNDLCDRPPRVLDEGAGLDIGGKRLRQISTPHVPHGWEAQVLFEETTSTLLCGDLLSHVGGGPALVETDVVGPAVDAELMFGASSLAPRTGAVLRSLGDLCPQTLAIMHGSSYRGDGRAALHALADAYESMMSAGPA
jgi:flavorubredoxin